MRDQAFEAAPESGGTINGDRFEWIADADIIDGIRYVRLEHMIVWKSRMGRDKDLRDIGLILDYIKNSDEEL